jgi:hypothetical protein
MPRKLTEAQLERIRLVAAARKSLPTNAELAAEKGCSKRLVARFAAGGRYRFPVERASKVHETLVELGLAEP